jgi:hypothetical protein
MTVYLFVEFACGVGGCERSGKQYNTTIGLEVFVARGEKAVQAAYKLLANGNRSGTGFCISNDDDFGTEGVAYSQSASLETRDMTKHFLFSWLLKIRYES